MCGAVPSKTANRSIVYEQQTVRRPRGNDALPRRKPNTKFPLRCPRCPLSRRPRRYLEGFPTLRQRWWPFLRAKRRMTTHIKSTNGKATASTKSTCLVDKWGQRLFFCASAIGMLVHLLSACLFAMYMFFFFCLACFCLHLHLLAGCSYGSRVCGTGCTQFRLPGTKVCCFKHSHSGIVYVVHAITNDLSIFFLFAH